MQPATHLEREQARRYGSCLALIDDIFARIEAKDVTLIDGPHGSRCHRINGIAIPREADGEVKIENAMALVGNALQTATHRLDLCSGSLTDSQGNSFPWVDIVNEKINYKALKTALKNELAHLFKETRPPASIIKQRTVNPGGYYCIGPYNEATAGGPAFVMKLLFEFHGFDHLLPIERKDGNNVYFDIDRADLQHILSKEGLGHSPARH